MFIGKKLEIGGVSYRKKDVIFAKQLENGKYEIILKTGEKIVFSEQKKSDVIPQIRIFSQSKGVFTDSSYINIKNIMGAEFTTTEQTKTKFYLTDCENCTVDLSANKSIIFSDSAHIEGGSGNKVILDKVDMCMIDGKEMKAPGEYKQ